MPNSSTHIKYFGALKCDRCGNLINEVALSKSGDEEHIYCRKCWADMEKEAKHNKKHKGCGEVKDE